MIDYLSKLESISKRFNDRTRSTKAREIQNRNIVNDFVEASIKRDFNHIFSGGDIYMAFNSIPVNGCLEFNKSMRYKDDYLCIYKTAPNEYVVSCKLGKCVKQDEVLDVYLIVDFFTRIYDKYIKNKEDYPYFINDMKYSNRSGE